MYSLGNTVPADWPQRADRSTYAAYAKLPSWHLEEAASLLAGYQPRQSFHLDFRPLHGTPAARPPHEGAKTWAELLEDTETVGRVIALLARYRAAQSSNLSGPSLHISPAELLQFCDTYELRVPDELREAVGPGLRAGAQFHETPGNHLIVPPPSLKGGAGGRRPVSSNATRQPEARYKAKALLVARELEGVGARHVTARLLKSFIESWFAEQDRRVSHRVFQDYIGKWRAPDSDSEELRGLLAYVLPESGGRTPQGHEDDLKKRLPERYRRILLSDLESAKTTRTTRLPRGS